MRSARTLTALAGSVAALTIVLSACSPFQPQEDLDPPIVAVVPPQTTGMDALLTGSLLIGSDCVYVVTGERGDTIRILPLFPVDVVRWAGEGRLEIKGEQYRDGDPIELGGGFVRGPGDERPLPADADIPAACDTDHVFAVSPF